MITIDFFLFNSLLQPRDMRIYLLIGRHLILFFPKKPHILQQCTKLRDDIISDLMIGRHLIPLFSKENFLNLTFIYERYIINRSYLRF